jgi:hypothetical protein
MSLVAFPTAAIACLCGGRSGIEVRQGGISFGENMNPTVDILEYSNFPRAEAFNQAGHCIKPA